jgi:uncharacterized protein (TIRG00374 family)
VVLLVAVSVIATMAFVVKGSLKLEDSRWTFAHLNWPWILAGIALEASSMAAFARMQRRLLRAGGVKLHLGFVMAVTYAGNAISVSLPLAGSEVAAAFSFRQFHRRGIEPAAVGWALAVSGIFSSLAFSMVLAFGALSSGNGPAAVLGLFGAVAALVPTVAVLAALRFGVARRRLNRLVARLVWLSRRLIHVPGPGAEEFLEKLLDRVARLRLPPWQYATVLLLAIWNWVADCLCLACAITATGSQVPWPGLFLAYGVGMTAASVGLTPGGLGVVEAALAAALTVAGIRSGQAVGAALVYRLISFWLVMSIGWLVLAILARRIRAEEAIVPGVETRARHT